MAPSGMKAALTLTGRVRPYRFNGNRVTFMKLNKMLLAAGAAGLIGAATPAQATLWHKPLLFWILILWMWMKVLQVLF